MRRTSSMAHLSNTCTAPVALDTHIVTDSWVHSSEGGLTEHTHKGRSDRQSARMISKTSTTNQEMQKSGKILRSTRRSLATDAVSELARSILHPALWWQQKIETCLWWPFMFGNGFPSRFVHFSFVASLSFRVWPAEVDRITGAGRQSPVRQTELIIGIRDVHSEVSACTSRTTLRWWTASKTTCSTAQVSVAQIPSEENDGVALQPLRIVCHAVEQQGVRLGNWLRRRLWQPPKFWCGHPVFARNEGFQECVRGHPVFSVCLVHSSRAASTEAETQCRCWKTCDVKQMKKNQTNCWANRKNEKSYKRKKTWKTTDSIIKQILDSSGT